MGERAAMSHTAALAGSDRAAEALFQQAGVIRAHTLQELCDVLQLVATQPLPHGRRVAILSNAGGLAILCADACEASGLEVPPMPERVRDALAQFLPAEASLTNPVDMIATATAEHYRGTIRALADWDGIDALIVIFIRPLLTRAEDVAAAIGGAHAPQGRLQDIVAIDPRRRCEGHRERRSGANFLEQFLAALRCQALGIIDALGDPLGIEHDGRACKHLRQIVEADVSGRNDDGCVPVAHRPTHTRLCNGLKPIR